MGFAMTDEKVIEITRPQISVIMGIYNCADTLPESIESIINQTFKDWELILCDDGSSDNTYQVARQYKAKYPEKIVLLRNKKNRGLNYTLNRCLRAAKGEFIARMDGDDRCPVNRFTKELEVLRRESDIAIVSTDMGFLMRQGFGGISLIQNTLLLQISCMELHFVMLPAW